MGFNTRTVHLRPLPGKSLQIPMRDLTAATIAGTKNQDFVFFHFKSFNNIQSLGDN
jgi:hypothetical protein